MKTKHTFKKGDHVTLTKAMLQRWRKLSEWPRMFAGKVGTVVRVWGRSPDVMVRFKDGNHVVFVEDDLESA